MAVNIKNFQTQVWNYYKKHKRDLEWRKTTDPYKILVSEIMLQQTQVSRVMQKYQEFISAFPDFNTLAQTPLQKVLKVWQGMGYNRRALYLQKCAQRVMQKYNGTLPDDPATLETFPGIGGATARSIVCFVWNKPVTFMETNTRRVFIHHFFGDKTTVSDTELLPYIEKALEKSNPRQWYYALMDYGAYLAKRIKNPNRRSKHYIKQSTFEGSRRQLRGLLLKTILNKQVSVTDKRFYKVAERMKNEGFIKEEDGHYVIA